MKKLLAMCLVLSMASAANAILIDTVAPVLQVVTNDIGQSGGRTAPTRIRCSRAMLSVWRLLSVTTRITRRTRRTVRCRLTMVTW